METSLGTKQYTGKEKVIAAFDPETDRWVFTGKQLSTFWTYGLESTWASRMYADYFKEFWAPVFDALKGKRHPQELTIHVVYHVGTEEESTLRQMMNEWVEYGNGYTAIEQSGTACSYIHLHIKDCVATTLTIEPSDA